MLVKLLYIYNEEELLCPVIRGAVHLVETEDFDVRRIVLRPDGNHAHQVSGGRFAAEVEPSERADAVGEGDDLAKGNARRGLFVVVHEFLEPSGEGVLGIRHHDGADAIASQRLDVVVDVASDLRRTGELIEVIAVPRPVRVLHALDVAPFDAVRRMRPRYDLLAINHTENLIANFATEKNGCLSYCHRIRI
jgi:hypothetical protein